MTATGCRLDMRGIEPNQIADSVINEDRRPTDQQTLKRSTHRVLHGCPIGTYSALGWVLS